MRRALLVLLVLAAGCSQAARETPITSTPSTPSSAVLRFAAVGDTGDGSPAATQVAEAIARTHDAKPIDLLLHLGDLIYDVGDPAEYDKKFAIPYRAVIERHIEVQAVLGNHDILTNPNEMLRRFNMPAPYYTFTRGSIQFFALNTSRGVIDSTQRAWLDKQLQSSTAEWKIAFTHIPGLSAGLHGSNQPIRDALERLFEDNGVRLSLAGHDHNYQRTHPVGGTTYIVTGGGCCPRDSLPADFLAARAGGLHFVVIEILDTKMTITALAVTGETLDRVEIGLVE